MPGQLVQGLSRADYTAMQRLNQSTLKQILRSPAHYKYAVEHPSADTPAQKLGTAAHSALLEPEDFKRRFKVFAGDKRTKEWKEFKAANAGAEFIDEAEQAEARTLAEAIRANEDAQKYLAEGRAELGVLWDLVAQPVGGLPGFAFACKARVDWDSPLALVDVKTTRDGSPFSFGRQAANLGYAFQAAWYVDGYFQATGLRKPFVIISVESKPPYVVTVYEVREELLLLGRDSYATALGRLDDCQRKGKWPGYADGPVPLELPRWATAHMDSLDMEAANG